MSEIRSWTCNRCSLVTSAEHAPKDCISALRHRLLTIGAERDKLVATLQDLKRPMPLTTGPIRYVEAGRGVLATPNVKTEPFSGKYKAGDLVRVNYGTGEVKRLVKKWSCQYGEGWCTETREYPFDPNAQYPNWDEEKSFECVVRDW